MAETNDGIRTFTAGEALEAHRRVKLTAANTVSYADAGEAHIGITTDGCASGDLVSVKLKNHPGTVKVTAAGAITVNADVYGAADGKVSTTLSGAVVFIALAAASGDGSVIEAMPELTEAA